MTPRADKTLTDGHFSYQYDYSRFYQPKNYPAKNMYIYIIGRNRGPAKTIFGQKSGPAMAGPAVPPTTALCNLPKFQTKRPSLGYFINDGNGIAIKP